MHASCNQGEVFFDLPCYVHASHTKNQLKIKILLGKQDQLFSQ